MQTRDLHDEPVNEHLQPDATAPRRSTGRGGRRLLTIMSVIVVLGLLVGTISLLFRQGESKQPTAFTAPLSTPPPPSGHWDQVLKGYTLTAPVAVPQAPGALYACASVHAGQGGSTILRSTDFGSTWQDVGKQAGIGSTCSLMVSSLRPNEIYVVSGQQTLAPRPQFSSELKFSADSGQTWTTIHPKMQGLNGQSVQQGYLQQLTVVGQQLLGLAWIQPSDPQNQPASLGQAHAHVVMSQDGGQTWTVLDSAIVTANQSVRSYAVGTEISGNGNSTAIYELIGSTFTVAAQPGITEPNDPLPQFTALDGRLFKSLDHGRNWQPLLSAIPYNDTVRVAESTPGLVYIGGSPGPMPLPRQSPQTGNSTQLSGFHLRVSSDGGTNWRTVPDYPVPTSIQTWFVAPDGLAYVHSSGYRKFLPGISGPGPAAVVTTPLPNSTAIYHYNPVANAWQVIAVSPGIGVMLALTPASPTDSQRIVIWFTGLSGNTSVLYRYIV